MHHYRLLPILWIALLLLAGCPGEPSGQAVEIATPTRPVATETPIPIPPTPTDEPTLLPTATEPSTAVESTPTLESTSTIEPTLTEESIVLLVPTATPTEASAEASTETNSTDDPWATVDPSGQSVFFWHRHTKYREKILNEIIDDFNANNTYGIWVKAQGFEDYGSLFDSTIAALNTADSPILVLGFQSDLAAYSLADASLDLTSLLDSPKWGFTGDERSDLFAWALDAELAANLGNVRTGLPMDRAADVLFSNRDWLMELGINAPPQTPEEFRSAACAATQQPFSGDRIGKGIGFVLSDNASTFASWVFAFDGNIYDAATGQFTLDSAEAVAAWSFLQGLINDGCARIASERYGDQADFGNGVALFAVGSSGSFYYYDKSLQERANFAWIANGLPHTGQQVVLNLSGPSIALIKSTPEQELAAWLFLKHYASADMQAKWARAVEGFPIRGSAFEQMDKYIEENPAYGRLIAFLPEGRSEPSVPGYGFIRGAMSDAITAIAGGADVTATLQQLNAEANSVVARQIEK